MLRKTTIALAAAVLVVCAGCQSHAQNKKAAQQRWEKASVQIKLSLAQQHYDNSRFDQAAKLSRECISVDPENPAARLLLGKVFLSKGKAEDAASQLRSAVDLDADCAEGWYYLGAAVQESGRSEQAWSCYQRALAISPNNVDYILAVAETYAAQDQTDAAIDLLEEKIEVLPREISLKVAAADLMCRVGQNERAADLYKQAMLLADDDESIAESLGFCYVFGGKWCEAADIFNDLAEQCRTQRASEEAGERTAEDQQREKLYVEMTALCSMNSAQYDKAVSRYTELSIEERDNADLWVKLGQAALGSAMTDRALSCGEKALSLRPGYADAVALIGCAQYANGDYDAAADSFERIVSDKETAGFSWLMMARCYEQLGQLDKAERAYKKAIQIDPDSEFGNFLTRNLKRQG